MVHRHLDSFIANRCARVALMAVLCLPAVNLTAAEDKKPAAAADEAQARKQFETDYEAGIAAVAAKNWTLAQQKFSSALKALGDYSDPKKSTAQVLQNKAERLLVKDDAMFTATELMRLKQWVEAEEAFRKVVDVSGETETLRKNILACRAGLEAEHEGLRTATELLKAHKWKEATEAYNKASDTLGGIRVVREGLSAAQLGIEADALLKKGAELLQNKQWDDAFNSYKRVMQIYGETEDVKKGLQAAQAGYAEERKSAAPEAKPAAEPAKNAPAANKAP